MTSATASGPTVTGETIDVARGWKAWRSVVLVGLIAGGVALYVTLVGIVGTFEERDLVEDVITVGEIVLLLVGILAGYAGARKAPEGPANAVLGAALAGFLAGGALALLILIGPAVDLRDYLPNASNDLYDLLTFDDREGGFWVPVILGIGLGALGGILALLPRHVRLLLVLSVGGLVVMGLFSGVLRSPLLSSPLAWLGRELFASNGLTFTGAVVVVVAVLLAYLVHVWLRPAERVRKLPAEQKRQLAIPMSVVLLLIRGDPE